VPRRGTCKGVRAGSSGRRRRVGQGGGRCRRTAGAGGTVMVVNGAVGGGAPELVEASGWMSAMARMCRVPEDRPGSTAASWSKMRPGRAQLARLQWRHLAADGPTPPAPSRSAPRVGRPLAPRSLRWSTNEPQLERTTQQPAASREAQQALAINTGGRRGERSGGRTSECLLQECVGASGGGQRSERRGDRCARPTFRHGRSVLAFWLVPRITGCARSADMSSWPVRSRGAHHL
jgi:hypothetical protein